jgi:hypothetical protein
MTKSIEQSNPTGAFYEGLQLAYNYFNDVLFDGKLPNCLITLKADPRSLGHFSGGRYVPLDNDKQHTDEIAMNAQHFMSRPMADVLSTLVHEQVHCWQHHFGKRPTRCYHDKQWAAKMKEVGLYPSDTAKPGGKETGPQMSHYIIVDGVFAKACEAFLRQHTPVLYQDRSFLMRTGIGKPSGKDADGEGEDGEEDGAAEPEKSKGRAKFVCTGCKLNAWAKPAAKLICGDCSQTMEKVDG